ncbi:hypothetical protein [Aquimarina pacifica]|uniref:hypothetical protein n=1 Tax=Aquimarina pacifica TaxID=1296415 RepID=UPI00046F0BFD|nr:hypothetical protein [Aquimarina pacifica]
MNTLEKERIVTKNVLNLLKENFDVAQTDAEILDFEPQKQSDSNYTGYYESILDIFFIEDEHLDSISGTVKDTIKKVTELWSLSKYSSATWEWQIQ